MYTLYYFPYSQHARRVVSLLEAAGLDYQLQNVALDQGEEQSTAYQLVNPNCQVPTLIDGDIKIHESNAILRYLCTKHKLYDWYPQELKIRAKTEQWLDWNQCLLSPSVIDIVLNKMFMGDQADFTAIERGEKNTTQLAIILDAGLADADFLTGENPTIADLSVASNIYQLDFASAKPTLHNIEHWYQRMNSIEGFKKSLPPLDPLTQE